MPRSAPSAAILAAVEELRARGVELSARQIESLQDKDALPKGVQIHDGGGGSRVVLPDDFPSRAEAAARLPARQRSAANVAAILYVTGHEITEADAVAIRDRARDLLDEMGEGLADKTTLRDQIRSSRSPGVRRARHLARAKLLADATIHDEAPQDADEVLAFELRSVGGLLAGDDDADVDETLIGATMLDRAVASLVQGVLGKLGQMLRAVGGAPELVTTESLAKTQWVWKRILRKATIGRTAATDPDGLVCAIATVVGIARREGKL